MTSYGGIIRIRFRVEVGLLPLSLHAQAPLYFKKDIFLSFKPGNKPFFLLLRHPGLEPGTT